MKNLVDAKISEKTINKFREALIEHFCEELEKKSVELRSHFINLGYSEDEVIVSYELFDSYDGTHGIKVNAKINDQIIKEYNTRTISAYTPSVEYNKNLNEAIMEAQEEFNYLLQKQINEKENEFISHDVVLDERGEIDDRRLVWPYGGFYMMDTIAGNKEVTENMLLHIKNAKDKYKEQQLEVKAQKEIFKNDLKNWALTNGSELLKLRIKHNQNWYEIANNEFALSVLPEFTDSTEDSVKAWDINNGTVEQLKELSSWEERYPDIVFSLERHKYQDEAEDDSWNVDYIAAQIQSISGDKITLYKKL